MFIRSLALPLCLVLLCGPAAAGDGFRLLQLEGHLLKWGAAQLGTPAEVTYRLVAGPARFAGAINCDEIDSAASLLEKNNVAAPVFRDEVDAAFAAWSVAAGIAFVPVESGDADILIGAQAVPRGSAYTNVTFDRTTPAGPASLRQAVICLSPQQPWKVGFDGDLDVYDLRYVLMHEIGHAIGLNHPSDRAELMHHSYGEKFRAPQRGDIAGAVALYGEPRQLPAVAAKDQAPLPTARPQG